MVFQRAGKPADNIRDNIRDANVADFIHMIQKVAFTDPDSVRNPVDLRVLTGDPDSVRINIDGKHILRAEKRGADGENSASRADIDHPAAGAEPVFKKRKAENGRIMVSAAESHSGIHFDDAFAGHRGVVFPGRFDDQLFPCADGMIKRFPVFPPVLVGNSLRFQTEGTVSRIPETKSLQGGNDI